MAFTPALQTRPVQCEDDPFGFNAVVVYGDISYPLVRCTPILTTSERQPSEATYERPNPYGNVGTNRETENNASTVEPTPQLQTDAGGDNQGPFNITPHIVVPVAGVPPRAYVQNNLGFTDVAMAGGGMGNYRSWQLDSHALLEDEDKDKRLKEKKKKVGRKAGKKSRRRHCCCPTVQH